MDALNRKYILIFTLILFNTFVFCMENGIITNIISIGHPENNSAESSIRTLYNNLPSKLQRHIMEIVRSDLETTPEIVTEWTSDEIHNSDVTTNNSVFEWSPNNRYLVSGDFNDCIEIRTATGKLKTKFNDITALAWSPNNQYLATGDCKKKINIYTPQGTLIKTLGNEKNKKITALGWSFDSQYIASSYDTADKKNATIRIHEINETKGNITRWKRKPSVNILRWTSNGHIFSDSHDNVIQVRSILPFLIAKKLASQPLSLRQYLFISRLKETLAQLKKNELPLYLNENGKETFDSMPEIHDFLTLLVPAENGKPKRDKKKKLWKLILNNKTNQE